MVDPGVPRRRATPSPPLARVVEPLLDFLNSGAAQPDLAAQASMSRARFVFSQFTYVFVALVTCFSLLLVGLTKIDNVQDALVCALPYLASKHLNVTLPDVLNETLCKASNP